MKSAYQKSYFMQDLKFLKEKNWKQFSTVDDNVIVFFATIEKNDTECPTQLN